MNKRWLDGGGPLVKGRRCIGNSLCVGPDGTEFARLPHGVDGDVFRAVDVPLPG
jgi:hypothetical protein